MLAIAGSTGGQARRPGARAGPARGLRARSRPRRRRPRV